MRDSNFLKKRSEPTKFTDETDAVIKGILARGPQIPASLAKRAEDDDNEAVQLIAMTSEERAEHLARHSNLATAEVIKSIHAAGSAPLDPDGARKTAPVIESNRDPTVRAIHKAHGFSGERKVDMDALHEMLQRGRQLRQLRKVFGVNKGVKLPPQNVADSDSDGLADDGADGNWNDQQDGSANTQQMGPRHAASISPGRPPAQDSDDPTVKALKRIFKSPPKRML